jgi:hypothetical protein
MRHSVFSGIAAVVIHTSDELPTPTVRSRLMRILDSRVPPLSFSQKVNRAFGDAVR